MNQDALLIGFDDSINLSIHLDYKDDEKIYIKLRATTMVDRREFDKLLNFLRMTKKKVEAVKIGKAQLLSPKSMAAQGHVWVFENGTLKITFGNFIRTLSQEAYLLFLTEMEATKNNLIRYDKVKDLTPEARAAMGIDEAGRPKKVTDAVYKARVLGYTLAVVIFMLNTLLSLASLFNVYFIPLCMAIYLILIDVYLLLPASEKKAIAIFRANAKDYMNEDMLKNLDGLPISRKGIELFVILGMVMVFMTAYFSKAIPAIMTWGENLYGENAQNALGLNDIVKTASMFKRNSNENFDMKKKMRNHAKTMGYLFETASKNHITLSDLKFEHKLGGGFLEMNIEGKALTSNPANFNSFKNRLCAEKPWKKCDGYRNDNLFNIKMKALINTDAKRNFIPMKFVKSSNSKVYRKIERLMKIFSGKNAKFDGGMVSRRKGKVLLQTRVMGTTPKLEQITGFINSIEHEPETLQILVDELSFNSKGRFDFSMTITWCFK